MLVPNFKEFVGQHCETTATGCLLLNIGIQLSEPLLFGLGEGLGFIFWNMKTMDFPFIGGRIKTDLLTQNICRNLNLSLEVKETASRKKAWRNVVDAVSAGNPVGLKLDCFHLDYFSTSIHFAGHYVAMYGFDENNAFLVDTQQQGGAVQTGLDNLAAARDEKGPMSSRNLSYTISQTGNSYVLKDAIESAIVNNSDDYLNPAISNMSYKGILKASSQIIHWFNSSVDQKRDFQTTAVLMERAGTGGSLFRNLYRDFLAEAYQITNKKILLEASKQFETIASQWTAVADCFHAAGETEALEHIEEASRLLVEISENERSAMQNLSQI